MKHPTWQEERKLWQKGHKAVVCLDEVGRGSLAGPVMACAVALNLKFKSRNAKLQFKIQNLRDSKKLTPKKREALYKILTRHPAIKWGIGKVYPKVIDRINILEATKLAMKRAVEKLKVKSEKLKVSYLILDGKMELDLSIPQKSIVKADEKVISCAIASIIAKVKRDRAMLRYHKKYPQYGFDQHKGYGTKQHLKKLKKFGPCKVHRKSFRPVDNCS